MPDRKRLYVTPLTLDLLPIVLCERLLQYATRISFHTIPTFPDRPFGYFDLPTDEADKLRHKLNGCLLKGTRMKVEEARARRSTKNTRTEIIETKPTTSEAQSQSIRNHTEGTVPAIELPKDRKVNRGWTEPAGFDRGGAKKSKGGKEKTEKTKASSITGKAECLFKTKLPANLHNQPLKHSTDAKKRKWGGNDRDFVVHEFKNSTKRAGFLKENVIKGTKQSKEYVEGQGWVDENGNLIEEVKRRRKSIEVDESRSQAMINRKSGEANISMKPVSPAPMRNDEVDANETSSSETSDSESEGEKIATDVHQRKSNRGMMARGKNSQGLGITSTEGEELDNAQVERLSISRSSGSPPPPTATQPKSVPSIEVHPLEALFKRPQIAASQSQTPKKPQLEVSTSFNFFDSDVAETGSTLMPQTPFTQQDIRHRRQRSAAPTPDTAAPGRTFGDVWGQDDDPDSDGNLDDEQVSDGATQEEKGRKKKKKQGQTAESDFAKWFWDHRGENNRAWKRRRREANKEMKAKKKNKT